MTVTVGMAQRTAVSTSDMWYQNPRSPVKQTTGRSAGAFETVQVPYRVLLIGGVGIVVGLATYGYKIMATIGKKITELTPSRGFSAEFAAATTIVVASKMGLPVSTTHTLVGAVIGVGFGRSIGAINTRVLRGIFASWFITVPFTALLAAGLFIIGRLLLL